jgi:para-nitrobenzyl esterase
MTAAALLAAVPGQVKVESGIVSGAAGLKPGVRVYKGIPFAAPPVGNLRWRPPQPPAHWTGVRNGDHFAPICPGAIDNPRSIFFLDPGPQTINEDCLYLNVWTAAQSDSERRPVMVWIYGGGFDHGSGTEKYYWGDDLAHKGAVVVTFDYRVGALGFLAHPDLTRESGHNASGNYGLMDQIAALQWVRRNIAKFGGDPMRVTIFGQSAGGSSVGQLMVSPLAKGLFQRAIGQSGGIGQGQGERTLPKAEEAGVAFAASLGAKSIAELRAKSVAQIRAGKGRFSPIVDGYVIPADPYTTFKEDKQNDVPVIAGSTANEGGVRHISETAASAVGQAHKAYGEYADEYLKFFPAKTDAEAVASAYAVAAARTAVGQRAWVRLESQTGKHKGYLYLFSRIPPFPPGAHFLENETKNIGAYHAVDLIYVFDHLYLKPWPWRDTDRKIADDMSSYWINFAANGDPNGKGLPNWPAFNEGDQMRMDFGNTVAPERVRNQAALDFLAAHPVTREGRVVPVSRGSQDATRRGTR